MQDDDLQYVVRMLTDSNKRTIAKNVGLSYNTVCRIANGKQLSPSYSTVKKMADYFKGKK